MHKLNMFVVPNAVCFVAEPTTENCDEDCKKPCSRVPLCINNTESCDESGNCTCKEGYELFDCCECSVGNETHGWYKAPNGSCLRKLK